jgi:hypothetical protein
VVGLGKILVCLCRVYGGFRQLRGRSMDVFWYVYAGSMGLWIDFWGLGQGLGDFRLIRSRSRHDFGMYKRGLWGF